MSVVFGVNGQRQDLLADAVSGEPNASYNAGFPPITMIAKSAGGQAPLGKDFNQIFNELSADAQWNQASGIYPYDAEFSTSIGGYPKGALVLGSNGLNTYQSLNDDNLDSLDSSSWVLMPSANIFGNVITTTISIFQVTKNYDSFRTRGFYTVNDSGNGVWVSTGVTNTSLSGTHVPKSARVYNANGYEYKLVVNSGDNVDARANGATTVSDYTLDTDDFVCIGEVINGITSQVKNFTSTNDGRTFLKVTIPSLYPYRQGKTAIKAYTRLELDFQQSHVYTMPGKSYKYSVTSSYMNAIERGIADVTYISNYYNGAAGYGRLTLTEFTLKGGNFYGDHNVSTAIASASTGTGLYLLNPENARVFDTKWSGYAVNRQYLRTTSGYYYDYLGNLVTGTMFPEIATQSLGSYEGVHEYDTKSFDCKYLHGRTISNWASFTNTHNENQVVWSNNPDGNKLQYMWHNSGAGVCFTGGAMQCTSSSAYPLYGATLDSARGVTYDGMYVEYMGQASFIINKPTDSSYYRSNGIRIDCIGSQYTGTSSGKPLVAFISGFFGNYNSSGLYTRGGWETEYNYYSGANTWRVGSPTQNPGAFPDGGYDFKYGTYNMYYSGSLPDIDSLRDTNEGNEFLTPYGLQVNSGNLLFPMLSPAHQSNIIIWIKDLTGNFNARNISINLNTNINNSDSSSVNLYATYGTLIADYGNGYKAILVQNVNPRPLDSRMTTSSANKLAISVTSSAPIILKMIQSYVGGFPLFPSMLPDYVPRSNALRLWGVQSSSSVDSPTFYGTRTGGGIFKPGDLILPITQVTNPSTSNPNIYNNVSSSYGSSVNSGVISSGYTLGGAMSGQTYTLTVTSVDSTNSEVTVSVPSSYAAYIICGMPINVTANSSGGSTGDVYIKRRVLNSDGTLSNSYTLFGSLGAVGTTLTVSTTNSYVFTQGQTNVLNGTTLNWTVDGYSTTKSGDLRVGYGASSSSNRQVRFYYDGSNVASTLSCTGSNVLLLNGYQITTIGATVPTSATSTGIKGQITTDSSYIYVCTATNTWVRTPITSW